MELHNTKTKTLDVAKDIDKHNIQKYLKRHFIEFMMYTRHL